MVDTKNIVDIVNEATKGNIKLRVSFGKSCIDYVIYVLRDYREDIIDNEFQRLSALASEINLVYDNSIIPATPPKKLKKFAGDYVFELYKQRKRA